MSKIFVSRKTCRRSINLQRSSKIVTSYIRPNSEKFSVIVSVTIRCQKSVTSAKKTLASTEHLGENTPNLNAYPNPGSSQITVNIKSDREVDASLQIISLSGVEQSHRSIRLSEGANFIVEDVSKLSQGNYVIKVGPHTTRFTKE